MFNSDIENAFDGNIFLTEIYEETLKTQIVLSFLKYFVVTFTVNIFYGCGV